MKTLILMLIIFSLLQAAFLPLNLVLIILICRAYFIDEKNNLILAFAFGLLNSHLNLQILGIQSLINLFLIEATQILSNSRLAGHPLLIIPLIFILLSIDKIINGLITHQSIHLMPQVVIESLLSLPIFFLVRIWEERFIVRKEIKLKI